ncbi:carbohydrate ABC transporter permease [Hungatella sp.]|uniref:carbohydrate ABC transporter permease n=1 Tax=Hungatella sp. TaxID=2613924 RepID=UPI002A8203B7|nr:carbohydrate ABC transporter permease [Hungatella sp.]
MKKRFFNNNKAFYVINSVILILAVLVIALPLLNVLASSFSSSSAVIRGQVGFLPVDFNLNAYAQILESKALWLGFLNSFFYTFLGTIINIVMTVMVAYPLSTKDFVGRNVIMKLFLFIMVFAAPLIPTYLNVRSLGLLDSVWALVLPGAISVQNMIIARTFFASSIPGEMLEASRIDGADDITILFRIVLPLAKPILAVLVLYYAISHWNSYFNAFIYLNSSDKFPLQVVLRNILSTSESLQEMTTLTTNQSERAAILETMKYAIIVFGSLPMVVLYPFVQKYFVKGVMIGSVKG